MNNLVLQSKNYLSQPQVFLCLLLVSFVAVMDFSTRVIASKGINNIKADTFTIHDIKQLSISATEREALNQLYKKYLVEEQSIMANDVEKLTAEQLRQQKGQLTEFVTGTNEKVKLMAVVIEHSSSKQKSYALLQLTNLEMNSTTIQRAYDNSQFDGFNVNVESSTRINLSKNSDTAEQNITLIMFAPANEN